MISGGRSTTVREEWAVSTPYPPLLWGFGVSLVERALIDAFCRATGASVRMCAAKENGFGIRLADLQPDLEAVEAAALLPRTREPVDSGAPHRGVDRSPYRRGRPGGRACGRRPAPIPRSQYTGVYGLTHLKIKLCGNADQDADRLRQIAGLMERHSGSDYAFTLDGNEQYSEIDPFRALWESVMADPSLHRFMARLLFVEQPPEARRRSRRGRGRRTARLDRSSAHDHR